MATTQEGLNKDQDEFNAAFNEDAPQANEPSEDEAFGLTPPENESPAEDAGEAGENNEGEAPAVVLAVADADDMKEGAEDAQAKETAEATADAGNADQGSAQDDGVTMDPEKEAQRLRSWEGRLKAMEAKLKEAGASSPEEQGEAVSEAIEKAADAAETPADEEKVEQIAEQVESGQMTAEQAMKQLAEDFGDDFVKMIEAIAVSKAKEAGASAASEKVGEMSKTVEEIIADISDSKAKAHFEAIAAKHPDFQEIANDPKFAEWIEAMPDAQQQEEAKRIASAGGATEINKLLDQYKAQATKQDDNKEVDLAQNDAMDAAEGVRSTGMRLPEQPAASDDDYLGAWDKY